MHFAPILIFVGCFGVGSAACARWLPDLEPGDVGGLAFLCVCGLLGAALALAGLHIYSIVHELGGTDGLGAFGGNIIADGLAVMLRDCGILVALALIVYLMAIRRAPAPTASASAQHAAAVQDV